MERKDKWGLDQRQEQLLISARAQIVAILLPPDKIIPAPMPGFPVTEELNKVQRSIERLLGY